MISEGEGYERHGDNRTLSLFAVWAEGGGGDPQRSCNPIYSYKYFFIIVILGDYFRFAPGVRANCAMVGEGFELVAPPGAVLSDAPGHSVFVLLSVYQDVR